ncbi:hypothetical protein LSTR_LSTR014723 [Laodelphax striatellus]|uniref:Uncharacterized protein n=1 Tax=Laodelphax striatellus TaxID=195883 RepID=A0A482X0E9_LAOST|nr:hypothetical protein LSTR_LSTR014723 [Laodelphax striatellus]
MLSSSKSSDRPTIVPTNASETFLPTYFVCVQRADSKIEKKAERNQVAEKSRHLNNLAESVIEVKRRSPIEGAVNVQSIFTVIITSYVNALWLFCVLSTRGLTSCGMEICTYIR